MKKAFFLFLFGALSLISFSQTPLNGTKIHSILIRVGTHDNSDVDLQKFKISTHRSEQTFTIEKDAKVKEIWWTCVNGLSSLAKLNELTVDAGTQEGTFLISGSSNSNTGVNLFIKVYYIYTD